MAGGGNDKSGKNNATQQDRHSNHKDKGDHSVTSSTSSRQSSLMGNSSSTNIPIEGGSSVIHCSGTVDSFNNHGKGSQDFSKATINSGQNSGASNVGAGTGSGENTSRSVTGTHSSFNCYGNGSQKFRGANINSGAYSGRN